MNDGGKKERDQRPPDPEVLAAMPYRFGVGMMVVNADAEVFVGQRIDTTMEAWQMPQGGIDEGEDPRAAALRELEEEIGTDRVEIIAETRDWLTYDLPPEIVPRVWKGRYRGQRQKWYLMRFTGSDADIDLEAHHPEFEAWRWMPVERLPEVIVPFKRTLYQQILEAFREHLDALK
jgi:putative (di)nucleoside polyphosphate hydrolase